MTENIQPLNEPYRPGMRIDKVEIRGNMVVVLIFDVFDSEVELRWKWRECKIVSDVIISQYNVLGEIPHELLLRARRIAGEIVYREYWGDDPSPMQDHVDIFV